MDGGHSQPAHITRYMAETERCQLTKQSHVTEAQGTATIIIVLMLYLPLKRENRSRNVNIVNNFNNYVTVVFPFVRLEEVLSHIIE